MGSNKYVRHAASAHSLPDDFCFQRDHQAMPLMAARTMKIPGSNRLRAVIDPRYGLTKPRMAERAKNMDISEEITKVHHKVLAAPKYLSKQKSKMNRTISQPKPSGVSI